MGTSEIELWGGVECTVNRVGDRFFDQVETTGHGARLDDLDRLASLGVRALRYPVLWERCAQHALDDEYDFSWVDLRLARLRQLGIRVIVGLVHHGSGPAGTSLMEESFVKGLARFAGAVARRYPWIEDYTPVNEPLTTARFSGLYGHWYPHARDSQSFLRALLIQTRATAEAMREVRSVTPQARLVQTEDFGSVFCSPRLKYQAEFENHRKWLSLDLLYGRVTRGHSLYGHLLRHGVSERELGRLSEGPSPPDLLGVNYYVTSDRFLDERLSRYPVSLHGSNGRDRYVDVEAVRVRRNGIVGHREVLTTAWARYTTPLALTEVHLGCTPEEQVRWLNEGWEGARAAQARGVDVRAVTLWSVFGAYDWDSLVTQSRGHYEPGAFDVRAPSPQPTALARVASELAHKGESNDPLLGAAGWWHRPERLFTRISSARSATRSAVPADVRPIVIAGAGGTLADAFRRACVERGLVARCLSRAELDVADAASVERALSVMDPWLLVNAAGIPWSSPGAEHAARCFRENVEGGRVLASACRGRGVRLVTFSSALVFDGEKAASYVESDSLTPTTVLGLSHASAECVVHGIDPDALVVRVGTLFGASPGRGLLWDTLRRMERGESVTVSSDVEWALAFAPDVAHASLDLAMAHASGTVHLAHADAPNLIDFLRHYAHALGIRRAELVASAREDCQVTSQFPESIQLSSIRVPALMSLEAALERVSAQVHSERVPPSTERAA